MATINEANNAYNAIVAAAQVGVTGRDAANARAIADVTEAMAIMAALEALVPNGPYCYAGGAKGEAPCPFWGRNPDEESDMAGYCALLKHGDWMDDGGVTFLFDRLKACGIRDGANFDGANFDGAAPDYDIDSEERDDSGEKGCGEKGCGEQCGDSLGKAPTAP